MRPLRLLPALALLALAACDGAPGPALPDGPVGTWAGTSFRTRTFVTLNRDQRVIDPTRPGEGDLRVSGDLTAEPRWLGRLQREGGTLEVDVTTFDPALQPLDGPGLTLVYREGTGPLRVHHRTPSDVVAYHAYAGPPPVLEGGRLTVPPTAFYNGAQGQLTAAGELRFVTRAFAAGVEGEAAVRTYATRPDGSTYTFGRDGAFRTSYVVSVPGRPPQAVSLSGRWAVAGDGSIRASYRAGDERVEQTFVYVEGEDRLEEPLVSDGCVGRVGPACLAAYERDLLLEEGTLAGVRLESAHEYARVGG